MNKIKAISRQFTILLQLLLFFLPTALTLKWMFIKSSFIQAYVWLIDNTNPIADVIWTPLSQSLAFLSQSIQLLPVLISLVALIRLFKNYQQGDIFSFVNTRYYRLIGYMFIFYGLVAEIIGQSLWTVATTINNPPGERMLTLGFGTPNLEAIFCGAVIIVISWVMLEANKLHDEQQYTV